MLSAAVALAGAPSPAPAVAAPAAAGPRYQVGIRDGYLKSMGHPDVWTAARAVGLDRLEVEVTPELSCLNLYEADGTTHSLADAASIARLGRTLKKQKVRISAFTTVIPLLGKLSPPEAKTWVETVAGAARTLKVPVIMVVPTAKGIKDEEYLAKAGEYLKPLEEIAARTKVMLAIENLGLYLNRPEILEPILGWFNPKHVGLALDICNMYWYGHPLPKIYELAKQFAPRVRYVHVKNVKYPEDKRAGHEPGWGYKQYAEPVATGDIDFKKILALYHEAGFRGDLTLEDDSLSKFQMPQLEEVHRQDVKFLRDAIREVSGQRSAKASNRS